MTTTKHKPGPWSLGDIEDGWVEIDALSTKHHHIGLAKVVWKMEDDDFSPVCEANARLIASAPELLEALQKIASGEVRNIGSARIIAKFAIAKVTGEQ